MLELMTEAAKRYGSGPGWGAVVGDAGEQARHGMDAPDEVQDGMEWYADEGDTEMCGPAPRMVALREPPNAGAKRAAEGGPLERPVRPLVEKREDDHA